MSARTMIIFLLISVILTLIFQIFFPDLGVGGGGDLGGLTGPSENPDTERLLAEYEFNTACGQALLRGCPETDFVAVLPQCQVVHGANLTTAECKSLCCTSAFLKPNYSSYG